MAAVGFGWRRWGLGGGGGVWVAAVGLWRVAGLVFAARGLGWAQREGIGCVIPSLGEIRTLVPGWAPGIIQRSIKCLGGNSVAIVASALKPLDLNWGYLSLQD